MKKIIYLASAALAFCMVTSCHKEQPYKSWHPTYISEHEAADLGLSVFWAKCNIGAECETDFGSLFAWGETSEKENYSWGKPGEYKFGVYNDEEEPDFGLSKYNVTDGLSTLQPEDDAVSAAWGRVWRTPTADEINELIYNCNWEWISMKDSKGNEIFGYVITRKGVTFDPSEEQDYIFLPAAGAINGTEKLNQNVYGAYWSSSRAGSVPKFGTYPQFAKYLDFSSEDRREAIQLMQVDRSLGFSVRGVAGVGQY